MFNNSRIYHLAELNLKGKVKSVLKTRYPVKDLLGEVIKDEQNKGFNLTDFVLLEFDSNGNQIRLKIEDSNGNSEEENYEYDELGNQVKLIRLGNFGYNDQEHISFYDENSKLIKEDSYKWGLNESFIYSYDNNKYLSEVKKYDIDGYLMRVWTYEYDSKGNITKMFEYNSNGDLERINSFKYDNNNRKIEDVEFDNENNISQKNTFKYDSSGNQIEEINYCSDDDIMQKYIKQYDNNGHIIKLSIYDIIRNIEKDLTYEYEFDNNNNWIKKYEFKNRVPKYVVERKITYFTE